MKCDEFEGNFELYALGSLETVEANALAEHLGSGCERCQAELRRAMEQIEYVSRSVPLVNPPARLRRRLQESFAPQAARRWSFWPWAVALAALLALAAGLTIADRQRQADGDRARAQSEDLARMSKVLDIMQAAGTRQVSFGDSKIRALHGSLYIHQKLGLALVIESLPHAPAGWKYESWLVPKQGAPQPVEAFQARADGRAVTLVAGPVNVDSLAAMAVSMEPADSHPSKPTTAVFSASI